MITFEKFLRNSGKRTKSKLETPIKKVFYALLTISVVKARISNTSTDSKRIFGEDTSSFCVHGKCTVLFSNGTSVSLPLAKFYTYMMEYLGHKSIIGDESNSNNFHLKSNLEKWLEKDERTEKLDVSKANLITATEISAMKKQTKNSTVSPASETDATEFTPTNICEVCKELNALADSNDTELANNVTFLEEQNLTSFNSRKEHKIHSRSISDGNLADDDTSADCSELTWIDDPNKTNDSKTTKLECKVQDPKKMPVDDSTGPNDESGKSNSSNYETIKPPITKQDPEPGTDHDPDCEDPESPNHGPTINATPEEIEDAKKMTECAKLKTTQGMVCVCNATYCDKFIPPDQTPPWIYTWYTSSQKGHRFRKRRNDLSPYKGIEDGAFYVNTSQKYQKIIGFGGAFTDSSCKLIKDLSKETKKNLLEAYFGPFGINYKLGRVPIGGTDFSPRFYTYIDSMDQSMSTFMLTEQDFKYKIPIILEVIELTHNKLKLIGSAWSAPVWMKIEPQKFCGALQRKYFYHWAKYHIKFLDQYLRNGVKFWAISTGNEPMNYYYLISNPPINSLEWTPYQQSQWVNYYLYPQLKDSAHSDVLLLAFDENREFVEFFMKYFSEIYQPEYFVDEYEPFTKGCRPYFPPDPVMNAIAGIQIHGYMDYKSNLPNLQRTKDLFPDKFLLYTETSCSGEPKSGCWKCGEKYATGIITALNNWATGWMDWNIALNTSGGPTYVNNEAHSPILVDVKKDEFYKESMFYIMGHFSLFLLPHSYRVEIKKPEGLEEIYAVAAVRPDGGKVIVFYNKYGKDKQVTFVIDKKYKLSIKVPKKSMNSVLFW